MTLSQLLNTEATILRRSPSGEEDPYGNELQAEEEVDVLCEVQQIRRDEPDDQGELSETHWLGIFPAGTELRTGDAVRVEGIGLLELAGDPWAARNPRLRQVSHLEVTMRRTAGDEVAS